ncbi:ribonuclease III [Chondrinema litorale]|uniref:ribonuclease III n=1 Tax=Chondrinema litorale TaxID=2994555 RepID=UPI0025435AD5|nr:ribonuclease III [Chondrinema litorale]UZR93182.1 ribonuclease III [Chondrinema litorale]
MNLIKYFRYWTGYYSKKDKEIIRAVRTIVGTTPLNVELYKLAMKHTSIAKVNEKGLKESNERLEYLGDAILGAVVAEYLFKKYPYKEEGFLTEIRSRIVNRESLNRLANKIGLSTLVEFDGKKKSSATHKSLFGDALEAFIGAVYLDKGFKFCKTFIIRKLIIPHYDLTEIIETTNNFKSTIIEWCQKYNRQINFSVIEEVGAKHKKQFKVKLTIDNEDVSEGFGLSKKKAEQDAARKACEFLGVI